MHEARNKTTDGVNLIRAEMEQKSEADELTDYVSRGKVSYCFTLVIKKVRILYAKMFEFPLPSDKRNSTS